jgi:hypothetical protein
MSETYTERIQSIFEVKVNEDKICSIFKVLQLSINSLEQQVNRLLTEKEPRLFNNSEE